jgi:hypothetical protein
MEKHEKIPIILSVIRAMNLYEAVVDLTSGCVFDDDSQTVVIVTDCLGQI